MKRTIFMFVILFISNLLYAESLSGKWISKNQNSLISLEFQSKNMLRYNGEIIPYRVVGNIIQIEGEYGLENYPYVFEKEKLIITFPESYTLIFKRPVQTQQNNNNYLLEGTLCSYSSSGYSGSGGYSSSRRVHFDGVGSFVTNTQSTYSGDAGGYYNQGNDDGGTYKVVGESVYLKANDGSTYIGEIIERSNGRISGLKINGTVYGSGLCD